MKIRKDNTNGRMGNRINSNSKRITLTQSIDEEDGSPILDLHDGHCNDCGYDFLMLDL